MFEAAVTIMKQSFIFIVTVTLAVLVDLSNQSKAYSCEERCHESGGYEECRCDKSCQHFYYGCCADYRVKCMSCEPPTIDNGYFKPQQTTYKNGTSIKFTCASGYFLDSRTAECVYGRWSYVPQCRRPVISFCLPPTHDKISTYTPRSRGYLVNSVIIYSCVLAGYHIAGTAQRRCTENGWTPKPVCNRIRCPHLGPLVHGSYDPPKTVWNPPSSVKYSCGHGYTLSGSWKLTCLYSGNWNHPKPHCTRVTCQHLGSPSNGFFEPGDKTTWQYNDQVTFGCDSGYVLHGSNTSNCQHDGSWSHALPQCVRIECVHRIPPSNGYIFPDNQTVWYSGDVVDYSCDPHYDRVGEETSECLDTGEWSSDVPTCTHSSCAGRCTAELDLTLPCQCIPNCDSYRYNCCPDSNICPVQDVPVCPEPQEPEYGFFNGDGPYVEGTRILFHCFPQFEIEGIRESTCYGGSWSVNPPTCKPKNTRSCSGRCGKQRRWPFKCDCHFGCSLSYSYSNSHCCQDYSQHCAL